MLKITINTDNDAFGEGGIDRSLELARILRDAANRIVKTDENREVTLRDYNGNKVGTMKLTGGK